MNEKQARRLVYERSGYRCEIDGMARATEWHHRRNRSQAGRWCPTNGLHLCSACHRMVTNTNGHRGDYEAKGWIVSSWRDPSETPVKLARRGWCYLHDDGTVTTADPGEQDGVDGNPECASS